MKTNDIVSSLILPNWPAPTSVKAFSTKRFTSTDSSDFNLALHVGDDPKKVELNRATLQALTQHPDPALWLQQTHSIKVIQYGLEQQGVEADGCFSEDANQTCVVMTADCLPVLFCSENGDFVAAVHAGWRGLAAGILLETLKNYDGDSPLMAWIGPAISQQHFEVGAEVRDEFLALDPEFEPFFANKSEKFMADLSAIAQLQLEKQGVAVYQSGLCSFDNEQDFYSYRRDGQTGRMASLIWIEND